jgi:hypothetical protein
VCGGRSVEVEVEVEEEEEEQEEWGDAGTYM